MGLHQSFVKFLMNRAPSASSAGRYPGSPQKRAPEGEITRREASQGIFSNRRSLTRPRLKKALKIDSGRVPGMGMYTKKQRLEFEKEDFSKKKYGTHFTPYELSKETKAVKRRIKSSRDMGERARLRKKAKYFEELKGDKDER